MREADQAPGSREGLGAQIRVLLIVTHRLPWGTRRWQCPKGLWRRREWITSQVNCLGWRWSSHSHARECAWSGHRLYWHNTPRAFRHQQAGGQCGHLQRSVDTGWAAALPYGCKGCSQIISFFSGWMCSLLKGKEDKEGCTSSITSATTHHSLKFYLRNLYWDTRSSLAAALLGSCH